jgi:hypothetical protein
MVENNKVHPYTAIGKLKVTFYNAQTKKSKWNFGTGFFFTPEHLLTVAHLFKI